MDQGDPSRAVGVVLDRRHLGRDAVLRALEVDRAKAALVTTALMARRDASAVVPPPFFVTGSRSDFSGSDFVTSSKLEVAMKRRPGLVGLYFFSAISGHSPCRSSAGSAKREQRKDAGSART